MTKILHIISSPRGDESLTKKLGNAIIANLLKKHPASQVTELDLSKDPFPHLDQITINGFFTAPEQRDSALSAAVQRSDAAVAQLLDADIIVIGAPMYNAGITSGLKAYFDHIARARVTFRYTEHGPEGLCIGKKAYVAISSAGVFDKEEMRSSDFVSSYITHFLNFIGISDLAVFRVEGTSIPVLKDVALEKALNRIDAAFAETETVASPER